MEWAPATKQDVLNAIEDGWTDADSTLKAQLGNLLADLQLILIDRCGNLEKVFVVARIGHFIVFFDDVENEFATAEDREGQAINISFCGNISFAL